MAVVSLQELFDLAVMIAVIGYIFKDMLPVRDARSYDPLLALRKKGFFSEGFKNAVIVAAPAIALHEIGHKVAAMSFGLQATFHAAYMWLGIGLLMKIFNAPFLFFVPGFVSYSGAGVAPLARSLIAFAGPAVNLLLFLFAAAAIKQGWLSKKYLSLLYLTKQINLFLLIFNMIPLGSFDGAHVFRSLMVAFGA